jgi:PAS domain S-box-containing protein
VAAVSPSEDMLPRVDWALRVLEAALDAIITIDATGRIVQFNRAAEVMFGYTRDEACGQPLGELIVPPDLRAAHWSGLLGLLAGEPPRLLDRRVQLRALRRSGEEFPVELAVTRTGEDPPRFTGFIRDLSELHRATERGTLAERLLVEAEALAGMGSWAMDLGTGRALWSDELYHIHGLKPGASEPGIGLLLRHVHADDRQRLSELLRTVTERPEEISAGGVPLEYRAIHPDGSVREVRARGRVELDAEGRPTRWVGSAQDVTDQRLTERELQAHYALGQALREWESFEEGVAGLLGRLGTALELQVGSLWTRDGDVLRCRAFWSAPGIDPSAFETVSRAIEFRPGQGVPGRTWQTGRPVITDEPGQDPSFLRREAAAELGLRTGLAFPAMSDDGPLAVLSFYGTDRRAPSERVVRTLEGIGRSLGRFLARRRGDLTGRGLSVRELEVLRLAADGNRGPQIAEALVVSPATIKTHFENIYEKLGVSDRAAAVAHALRAGLID